MIKNSGFKGIPCLRLLTRIAFQIRKQDHHEYTQCVEQKIYATGKLKKSAGSRETGGKGEVL